MSTILLSVMEESHIPEQHETNLNVHPKGFLTAVFMGCLAGIVVGFLPAIGVSQAVLLIQQIGGIRETEMFLISLASVNMANEIFSLNSLYLLNNPRSGSSIAIQKILEEVDLECNMLLTSSILISTFLASCIVWSISDRIIKLLEKCDYKKLNITTSFAIILMVWVFTGFFGIFILLISTSLGLLCNLVGAKRSYCMGSLLLPSITFFAGIQPIILENVYA